jgi:hypothetical protein
VPLASEGGVSQVRLDAATMTEGRWSGGRRTHSRLGVSTMRLKDNCGVVAFGNRHLGWLQLLIQIHADSTGIGQGRVTSNLKPDIHLLTGALHVPDSASINMVYRLGGGRAGQEEGQGFDCGDRAVRWGVPVSRSATGDPEVALLRLGFAAVSCVPGLHPLTRGT